MALFQKTALSSAILMAMAASSASHAAIGGSTDGGNGDKASKGFVEGSTLNLDFKNYYRRVRDRAYTDTSADATTTPPTPAQRDFSSNTRDRAWAQGFSADFQSGWLANWVGIDASAYYSARLSGRTGRSDVGLLRVDSNNRSHSYGQSLASVKVNLFDHGLIKYGRMTLDTPLISSDTEFTIPSAYQGFFAKVNWEGLDVYGGYIDEVSPIGESGFRDTSARRSTDPAVTTLRSKGVHYFGGEYNIDGLRLRAQGMTQKDYQNNSYGDIGYTYSVDEENDLNLAVQGGHRSLDGNARTLARAATPVQKTSYNWWGAKIGWSMASRLETSLSYVSVEGRAEDYTATSIGRARSAIGYQRTDATGTALLRNEQGNRFIGYTAGMINDFDTPGTTSGRFDVKYDLSDFVEGLSVMGGYTRGRTDVTRGSNSRINSREYDVGLTYDAPFLKGLYASVEYGSYRNRRNFSTPNSDNSGVLSNRQRQTTTDTRVIVGYKLAVF